LNDDDWQAIRTRFYELAYAANYGPECEDAAGSVVFPFMADHIATLAGELS
jgi:hypothetical protein